MSTGGIELHLPTKGGAQRAQTGRTAIVLGGGLAGLSAATVLAEKGVAVEVLESRSYLGGRAGAWSDRLRVGGRFQMERGFHAFFRQYYNLRALLRRVDPELSMLEPLEDYPVLGPDGVVESFSGLPKRSPWNVIALTKRTPTMGLGDLAKVNGLAALEMMRYDPERTYERFDERTAAEYLDSLRFPEEARRMLFNVFSHSFFNPEEHMSAAELLMMFHFYFIGNPEGLIFDVCKRPFSTAIFRPLERYLAGLGGRTATEVEVQRIERTGDRWRVHTDGGVREADSVVAALHSDGLRALVEASPDLDIAGWREQVASLDVTLPFVVWRLWLDRPVNAERGAFVGTTGVGRLDNISVYERFEDESAEWAASRGGSVVELHAYGVQGSPTVEDLKADLLAGLHHFYPETQDAQIIEERWLYERDCPAFAPGSHRLRPPVETPFPGLALAGDLVRLPFPSALMERATASGFLAANTLLAEIGVAPEPLRVVSPRGLFAGPRFGKRKPPTTLYPKPPPAGAEARTESSPGPTARPRKKTEA